MNLQRILLDTIFPHICVCGKWGYLLCPSCLSKIKINFTQTCPICRKISENGKTCKSCRSRTALTGVMIFGEHTGVLKKLIWEYKYEFIRDLAEPLTDLLVEKFGNAVIKKKPMITYVPITKKRLNWRGFNQSELLARLLAKKLNLDCVPLLSRNENAKTQVGLSRNQRIQNLKGQIKFIKNEAKIKVILVDDVYTTGATLEECALILRKNGFKEIYGLVLSRD